MAVAICTAYDNNNSRMIGNSILVSFFLFDDSEIDGRTRDCRRSKRRCTLLIYPLGAAQYMADAVLGLPLSIWNTLATVNCASRWG